MSTPLGFQYPPPTARTSTRTSYPTFLSLHETLLLQLSWAWAGLCDAFRWSRVVVTITSDAEIRGNVYKSLMLNSLSLLSIYVFDLMLQPLVQNQQKWFHRNIGWFYQVLWLCPVVGTSLYLNGTWCTVIAKRTYMLQHGGRPVAAQPMTLSYSNMLTTLATSAYRIVMVCTSVVLSFALSRVPIVGPFIGFSLFCWVNAYYCFEFVWIARGLSLARRIRYLEERWIYFFAFGLPSTVLCVWGTALANAAMFALIFPMYIIMAITAKPVPNDPYNPSPATEDVIRHPSPFIPIRLPIFALVIWINDGIVKLLNVVGGRPPVRHKAAAPSLSTSSTAGRRRLSDATESAEEGGMGSIQMQNLGGKGGTAVNVGKGTRPVSTRVNLGRRKND